MQEALGKRRGSLLCSTQTTGVAMKDQEPSRVAKKNAEEARNIAEIYETLAEIDPSLIQVLIDSALNLPVTSYSASDSGASAKMRS